MRNYISAEKFEEIQNQLNKLLARKISFPLNDLPKELLPAFNKFIIGMTCPIQDGKMYIYHSDFLLFYKSLCGIESEVGFD